MGRPMGTGPSSRERASKGERTRGRLLQSAVRRFAADGFKRTSVTAVAEQAGVTPGAVYAYFAGKEGLFEAAVDADAHALIDEAVRALLREGGKLATSTRLLLPLLIEGLDHHPLARRVLAGQEPEVIDRLLTIPALQDLRLQVTEALTEAQTTGEVRADVDPKALAIGLETLVLALLMASLQVHGVETEREDGVTALFDAILRPPSSTS